MSLHIDWSVVSTEHVLAAIEEYDDLGATTFFARHGFGPTTTYDLRHNGQTYPPKAILGRAYEIGTHSRLAPTDFEGGKSGAVKVLTGLGFDVEPRRPQ